MTIVARKIFPDRVFGKRGTIVASLNDATGPILPIGSDLLALTALNAFRPHRWRGALIPKRSRVEMVVLEPDKRPIMADADSRSVKNVAQVNISSADDIEHRLLFDPGHGLEERLISEQFI